MTSFSAAILNEYDSSQLVELVEAIDGPLAYDRLFVADERFYRNPYTQLATAVELATGVTNPNTRNPAFTAAAIATIDDAADGRALLGLGAGSPMALDPIGIEQAHPIGAVRDAVLAIRQLLGGESVSMERPEFELHDLSLDFEPDRQVPIYVAGRGPQILSLAGRVGDGAIAGAGLTSEAGMEYAMDRVAEGARAADRDPESVPVTCWAFLSMAPDRSTAVDAVLPLIARIVQAVPLDTLTAIGLSDAEAEAVKALDDPDAVEPAQLREAVSRSVVEQFCIAGTPAHCRDHVERLRSVGTEHFALLPFENAAHDALRTFSTEVASGVGAA